MVGISHAPRIARVTRAAALEIAQRDFVHAAEALGVSRRKILSDEILPNITSPLLVEFGLRLTYSIGIIAALSFLGFGLQPPAADWGLMINENRIGITVQPYAGARPGAPHRHPHDRHQPDRRRHRRGPSSGSTATPEVPHERIDSTAPEPGPSADIVLSVADLRIVLDPSGIDIDDDVSFAVAPGEVLGLVGESASGKTTAATSLLAHQRRGAKIAGGTDHASTAPTSSAGRRRRPAPHPRRPHQLRAPGRLGGPQPGPAHRHAARRDPRGARRSAAPVPSVRRASPR